METNTWLNTAGQNQPRDTNSHTRVHIDQRKIGTRMIHVQIHTRIHPHACCSVFMLHQYIEATVQHHKKHLQNLRQYLDHFLGLLLVLATTAATEQPQSLCARNMRALYLHFCVNGVLHLACERFELRNLHGGRHGEQHADLRVESSSRSHTH